jgi:hypothetical protein
MKSRNFNANVFSIVTSCGLVGRYQHFRRPRRRWEDNIKTDLRDTGERVWIKFIWLSIKTGGGLFCTR